VAHVPERTCVGCRGKAPKSDLMRIVRADVGLALDRTGHAPGRGAYMHRERACVDAALAKGWLARALSTGPPLDELGRLRNEIETGEL